MAQNETEHLYIQLFSIHGLIREKNPELGRDADTGGQVKYVLELAKKLAEHPRVKRVDLLTRQIFDPKVDKDYQNPQEQIGERAYIVRLPCGPKKYLRKEVLWPYMDVLSDQMVQYVRRLGMVPDIIHGHYADGGYVGTQVARLLGVPFVFTGHSLGRVKRERLKETGMDEPKMEGRYNISQRIEAEEFALDTAALVIASTQQEIEEQYQNYENYDPKRMIVIPPGIDLERFHRPVGGENKTEIAGQLNRFLKDPKKPMILAISRADERKNIATLIKAYGQNAVLREKANLVIFAGDRDDLQTIDAGARKVLYNLLNLIDKYDLYGMVAYPKTHTQKDVRDVYRLAARLRGIFVNPALTEPFGLTLLEAAACGLPLVATNDGGPIGIIGKCENGILIDPLDSDKMAQAIQKPLEDRDLWSYFSKNGLRNVAKFYSWESHARNYINKVEKITRLKHYRRKHIMKRKTKLTTIDKLVIADIDNTLLGDAEGARELMQVLKNAGEKVGMGIATGRRLDSTIDVLKKWNIPTPDILITSVGSEVYYGEGMVIDRTWSNHLNYKWKPSKIREAIVELPGLRLQPEIDQREYKVSFFVDPEEAPNKNQIMRHLRQHNLQVKAIFSHNAYLDILPIRASKGLAVRYLLMKWGLNHDHVLVAGDSGNDEEMLRGDTLAVVVGNYSPELRHLYGKPRIYFAEESYAKGIIEGINYYNFLELGKEENK